MAGKIQVLRSDSKQRGRDIKQPGFIGSIGRVVKGWTLGLSASVRKKVKKGLNFAIPNAK